MWPYDDKAFCDWNSCSASGPSPGPFLAAIPAVPAPSAPPTYTFNANSSPRNLAGEEWVWDEPDLTLRLHYLTRIFVNGTFEATGTTITAADPAEGWYGLVFLEGSKGTLTDVVIENRRSIGGGCCHPRDVAVNVDVQGGTPTTVTLDGVTLQGNTGTLSAGAHRLTLDGSSLAPGIYVVRAEIKAGGTTRVAVRRLVVAR